jgi:hypothetical protein
MVAWMHGNRTPTQHATLWNTTSLDCNRRDNDNTVMCANVRLEFCNKLFSCQKIYDI